MANTIIPSTTGNPPDARDAARAARTSGIRNAEQVARGFENLQSNVDQLRYLLRRTSITGSSSTASTGMPPAPTFAVTSSLLDSTVAVVSGLTFASSANTSDISGAVFGFYYCDPATHLTTLAANLGLADTSMTLTDASHVTAGEYLQIGREIVLAGSPSGAVVPITRAQLGSTADTGTTGDSVFALSERVSTAALPLNALGADIANWQLLESFPNQRLGSVAAYVKNGYGTSTVTVVNLTGNADHGLLLSAPAPGASSDAIVAVTNTNATLTAGPTLVNVVATTTDCTINAATNASMTGQHVGLFLAPGSTNAAKFHPAGTDTINGASGDYTHSTAGAAIWFESTGAGDWLIVGSAGGSTTPAAPNAPNVTIASATSFYDAGTDQSGFQFTLNLPTADPNYSHLKQIYGFGTSPDGRSVSLCSPILSTTFSGSTVTIKGATFPSATGTWTLVFWAINDDGVATPVPATTAVAVSGAAVTGVTASDAQSYYQDSNQGLHSVVAFIPTVTGTLPQSISVWAGKSTDAPRWRGWWDVTTAGSTLYIGAQGAFDANQAWTPTKGNESWTVIVALGRYGNTDAPPADAVTSSTFTMYGAGAPPATDITNAQFQASPTTGDILLYAYNSLGAPVFDYYELDWTQPLLSYDPFYWFSFVTIQKGAVIGGVWTPAPDYEGGNDDPSGNFLGRWHTDSGTVQGGNSVAGSTVKLRGDMAKAWTFPPALNPDGTTNIYRTWRIRIYAVSRAGTDTSGGSGVMTLQTCWAGGADHYDISPAAQLPNLDLTQVNPHTLGPGIGQDGGGKPKVNTGSGLTISGSNLTQADLGYTMSFNGNQIVLSNLPAVFGLPSLPSSAYPQGSVILNTVDSKVYRNTTGSTWVKSTDPQDLVAGAVASGVTISAAQVSAGTLAAGVVYAGAVAASQITAGTISATISLTSPTISGGTITGATLTLNANGATTTIANQTSTAGLGVGISIEDNSSHESIIMTQNGIWLLNSSGQTLASMVQSVTGNLRGLLTVYDPTNGNRISIDPDYGISVNGTTMTVP